MVEDPACQATDFALQPRDDGGGSGGGFGSGK